MKGSYDVCAAGGGGHVGLPLGPAFACKPWDYWVSRRKTASPKYWMKSFPGFNPRLNAGVYKERESHGGQEGAFAPYHHPRF
jgi:hypothetical protein